MENQLKGRWLTIPGRPNHFRRDGYEGLEKTIFHKKFLGTFVDEIHVVRKGGRGYSAHTALSRHSSIIVGLSATPIIADLSVSRASRETASPVHTTDAFQDLFYIGCVLCISGCMHN